MKRLLLLFSDLMILISALWAHGVEVDGIYYNLYDKTAEVTYRGSFHNDYSNEYSGSVTIPETITYNSEIYSVTSIGNYAFYNCSSLTSVTIGNSVTSIGNSAFSYCRGLTSVTIPNSVTSIGDDAFYGCPYLTSVTIGNNVTSIGEDAFSSCASLTKVNYLGSVDKWVEIDFENNESNPTYYYAKDLYINNELLTDVKISTADSIKKYAFYNCKSIKSVEIGNSVTSIGDAAFYNCYGLTSVNIPNSVTSIDGYAFSGCRGLTSVELPNSVTSIGDAAFYNCYGLTSVNIPNSVTSIGDSAFYYCSGLTSVNIGNSVTSIGSSAFCYCYGLTSVTIPNSVTSIGWNAFSGCRGLTSVTIGNSVTSIGNSAFSSCSSLTSVVWNAKNCADFSYFSYSPFYNIRSNITSFTFGNEVEYIPSYLCYGMENLKEITIPFSVTSIGEDAFRGCTGLTKVNYLGSVDKWVEIDFENDDSNPTYNEGDLYINGELLTDVKISTADSIKKYAFYNCESIKSIEIGNSVTYIGDYAFDNCSGLTSVVWNTKNYSDFSDYDYSPFYNIRSNITSFTFGNEVEHIPAYLCYGMSSLEEITIPNNVTSIGYSAFSGCYDLTSVVWNAKHCADFSFNYGSPTSPFYNIFSPITSFIFGNEVEYIPAYLCFRMGYLKEITIPSSVTSIGDCAFEDCSGLTSVDIGNNVTSIGDCAFEYCSRLTSVDIGNNITSIGDDAFGYCSDLTSVEIPNSVTSIGDYAFNHCSGLTSVTIGNSVTSIGDYAFNYCSGLTSVTIGNSVTSIGNGAFKSCSGLTSVIIGNSVTSIGDYVFNNCSSLTSVVWNAKNYSDFSNNSSSPFYDFRSKITSLTFGSEVEHIPAYLCYEMSNLTKVNYLGTVEKWVGFDFSSSTSNPTYYAKNLYINGELLTDVKISSADSIKDYVFYNCKSIESVKISSNVTSIGSSAFYGCSDLKKVVNLSDLDIIKGKTTYGYVAYYADVVGNKIEGDFVYDSNDVITDYIGDLNIISIEIPLKVKGICKKVFAKCAKLTSVVWNAKNCADFSNNYVSPFYNIRSNITSFTFGNEVEYIPSYLCYGMENLKEITIPSSVTSIGDYAFRDCTGLTKVNYLGSVDKWVEIDFKYSYFNSNSNPTYYAKDLYINGELLTDVKITSAESIGDYAFYNCKSIKSVEIGDSVTSIGSWAFEDCSGLTKVNYLGSVDKWVEIDFYNSYSNPTYYANDLYINGELLTDVKITSAESIGDYAFYNCKSIKSVEIGDSVTSIGSSAFENCYGLTSVIIGNSVTSIGNGAFMYCSGLTSVNIGNNVTSIASSAFYSCYGLTSVVWNVKYYEDFSRESSSPFYNSDITSFIIGNEVEYVPTYLCCDNNNLTSVIIGENVRCLGAQVFKGCDNLKRVTAYPKSVPSVYENTFAHYNAYLYVPCDVYENYDLHNVFGSFKYIKCIAADEVEAPEKVEIEVDENNNATVIWPSINSASSYELVISKDGTTFCTLIFNANGQLTSIDFNTRSAEVGFQFTVTGLDGASKYKYKMTAKDKKDNELISYNGVFATNGYKGSLDDEEDDDSDEDTDDDTAIIENLADANITISEGVISCPDSDFTIYNTIGQNVTSQNGSLTPGVYVVQVDNDFVKVMMK